MIQPAFERHQAIEIDDYASRRQIKKQDCQQPEDDVRRAELACRADPRQPHDEQYLREREVCQPKLFFEDGAALFDLLFGAQ